MCKIDCLIYLIRSSSYKSPKNQVQSIQELKKERGEYERIDPDKEDL